VGAGWKLNATLMLLTALTVIVVVTAQRQVTVDQRRRPTSPTRHTHTHQTDQTSHYTRPHQATLHQGTGSTHPRAVIHPLASHIFQCSINPTQLHPYSGISWTTCKQSAPCFREITTSTPYRSIFTGWMLFLMPNQQCQSTEGNHQTHTNCVNTPNPHSPSTAAF